MSPKQETQLQEELTAAHNDYAKGLSVRAFLKINNHATSDDLVQDTFMKTWMYMVKGGKIDIMKAFLYHILNNLIIDEYRKHTTTSLDTLMENGFEPKDENSEKLITLLDGKVALLLIQHLPEKYQKVMRMRYVQDLSLEDMTLITGQSKNALAVQLHRGLKMLKRLYDYGDLK